LSFLFLLCSIPLRIFQSSDLLAMN
jgi:hypothetical protein